MSNYITGKEKVKYEEPKLQEKLQSEVLLSDTTYFNGMNKYPNWGKMYKVFNEQYSQKDEDYETLVNIHRLEIYQVASRPTIIPYDDMSRWEFTHVDTRREAMVNEVGIIFTSLKSNTFEKMYTLKSP